MSENIVKNDFNEIWSRWEPDVPNLACKYYIASICYNYEDFRVILEEEGGDHKIELLFSAISSFCITDEGRRLKLYDKLSDSYGTDFYRSWTFFKVEQSEYLKWLSIQSYEISDICKVQHFALLGIESVLDIRPLLKP